jgi:hypothetical protein
MLVRTIEPKRKDRFCLSCGKLENINNRRYCSIKCRQNLRQKLNMKNGLLQTLNTRYATFYFSDTMIILDVVPHGCKEIYRYTCRRREGSNPAADFHVLTNKLGESWWAESKRTSKNYKATQHVLTLATRHAISDGLQRPKLIRIPVVRMECLDCLKIEKADLHSRDLNAIIKNAYRHQVKIHHPDMGGHASTFRKIHNAYKELIAWADNPTYVRRRGFTDKWYYDGDKLKWVQPVSVKR